MRRHRDEIGVRLARRSQDLVDRVPGAEDEEAGPTTLTFTPESELVETVETAEAAQTTETTETAATEETEETEEDDEDELDEEDQGEIIDEAAAILDEESGIQAPGTAAAPAPADGEDEGAPPRPS